MIDECAHWVTLPKALGSVTGFRQVGERLICDTQSGIPFVIPLRKHFIAPSGQSEQISLSPKPVS